MMSIRAAQNLQKMGHRPRQMISIMANNCDDMLPIFLTTIYLACPIGIFEAKYSCVRIIHIFATWIEFISVPFFESLSPKEIINILVKTKPTIMFCDAKAYQIIRPILNDLDWKIQVFTFGARINDDTELASRLFLETGDENNFVWVYSTA